MASKTFQEAKQYLDDPHSCFKLLSTTKHIALSPCYLGKLRSGVHEELNSEMHLFSESLNGVLIAFDNVKLLQPFGNILDDQPYIHFDINLDMIVFQPTVGSLLRGVVHKIGVDHIGCLVHGRFNAAILKPKQTVNGWKGAAMSLGEEFIFRVVRIETERGVLSMKGVIEDVEPRSHSTLSQTQQSMETDVETETTSVAQRKGGTSKKSQKRSSEVTETSLGKVKKQDTKEKRISHTETDGSVSGIAGTNDDGRSEINVLSKGKEKHRKRKRDKLKMAEPDPDFEKLEKVDKDNLDSPSLKRLKKDLDDMGVSTEQNSQDMDGGSTSKGQNGKISQPSSSKGKKSKKSKRKDNVEKDYPGDVNIKVEPESTKLSDKVENVKKKSKKSKKSKKK